MIENVYGEKNTYNHADIVSVSFFSFFNCFINDQIHEWVKSSQDTNNVSPTIELDCNTINISVRSTILSKKHPGKLTRQPFVHVPKVESNKPLVSIENSQN